MNDKNKKTEEEVVVDPVVINIEDNDGNVRSWKQSECTEHQLQLIRELEPISKDLIALENKFADRDALLASTFEGKVLSELLVEKTAVIGEKVDVSNYALLASEGVAAYNHGANRIGVLVALNSNDETALQAGRDLAMQIAAMNPIAVDENAVSQEVKEKELEIGRDIARQEGKPEAMLDKIAEGKLQRFYKDNTLMHQAFVKDSSMNVAAFLKSVNPDLKVKSFARLQLGA